MQHFTVFFTFSAKYNAEMYYAVVGVQDDIETSLCVMAHYLPLFFKRALNIYRTMGMVQLIQTENSTLASLATQRQLKSKSKAVLPIASRKSLKFTKNKTPHKQQISKQARMILTKNMTLEYEFFGFIKQRLKLQVSHLRKKMFPRTWCKGRTSHMVYDGSSVLDNIKIINDI